MHALVLHGGPFTLIFVHVDSIRTARNGYQMGVLMATTSRAFVGRGLRIAPGAHDAKPHLDET